MNAREFNRRIQADDLKGRAVDAARHVLVDGLGVREAARQAGLSGPASVSRAVARISKIKLCPTCGQPLAEPD